MQIRVGNRQDEPLVRTIIFQAQQACGIESDLETRDADLRNIEQNYFWYDGIFLVAEREGQIIGAAGARRRDCDDLLELWRLAVAEGARKKGVAKALLSTVKFFAGGMDYKKLVIGRNSPSKELAVLPTEVLSKLGFKPSADSPHGCWEQDVTPVTPMG